jgi:hypothetical protein
VITEILEDEIVGNQGHDAGIGNHYHVRTDYGMIIYVFVRRLSKFRTNHTCLTKTFKNEFRLEIKHSRSSHIGITISWNVNRGIAQMVDRR